MSLSLFLCGARKLRVPRAYCTAVMNLCMQMGITYTDFAWGEECVTFRCGMRSARRLIRACQKRELVIEAIGEYGVPSLLFAFAKRPGLVAGALLAVCLAVVSSLFVWSIEVVGNESMTEQEVVDALRVCDFGVGSYLPGVRVRELENRILIASERIAWISIYLDGTVARVQVIEQKSAAREQSRLPANLIATADGQIEYLQLYRGESVVQVGQAVKKGELLVSGIYESGSQSFRYTRAAGEVMARTERTIVVEIPLQYEQKVAQKPQTTEIVLHFFNFSMKIFKNCRNLPLTCDIIKNEIELPNSEQKRVPISLTQTVCQPYLLQTDHRSAEQALSLCYEGLEEELARLSDSAQLLRKSIATTIGEESVILTCTVECIENIAAQQEFEIIE